MNSEKIVAVGVAVVSLLVVGYLVFSAEGEKLPAAPAAPIVAQATPAPAPEPESFTVVIKPPEEEMKEIVYLPKTARFEADGRSLLMEKSPFKPGNRRLVGVRAITDKTKHGEFIAPRFSPDGLQMIATRQGHLGIFIIDVLTGTPRQIADGNAFFAKWTADGLIEVKGEDGLMRLFNADGTLQSTLEPPKNPPVFQENDTIYVRTADGGTVPVTDSEDKFFNPVVSPDGRFIAYNGLITGLYIAPADGSAPPTLVGRGNNPIWSPDGKGLIYDVTADDGHHTTAGDIYQVDPARGEQSNLTEGDSLIGQTPSISPDGGSVVFEADGQIYSGELR